jgi:RNA polymerase sigma factor (sigma-70 family)
MMYSYVTATAAIKIDLDEQFYKLLIAMDQDEYNSDRKHSRRHPIPLDHCEYQGEWFEDKYDIVGETDFAIDLERALSTLTDLQRVCFVATRISEKTQQELAAELGKSRATVQKAVDGAITILKRLDLFD